MLEHEEGLAAFTCGRFGMSPASARRRRSPNPWRRARRCTSIFDERRRDEAGCRGGRTPAARCQRHIPAPVILPAAISEEQSVSPVRGHAPAATPRQNAIARSWVSCRCMKKLADPARPDHPDHAVETGRRRSWSGPRAVVERVDQQRRIAEVRGCVPSHNHPVRSSPCSTYSQVYTSLRSAFSSILHRSFT